MSIEVDCPSCRGSIQIEDVSEVVECPLCQFHLQMDPETNQPVLFTEPQAEAVNVTPEDSLSDSENQNTVEESSSTSDAGSSEDESLVDVAESAGSGSEETQADAETNAPFAFLPGGNHNSANSRKKQKKQSNAHFSFLPGGNSEPEETNENTIATTSETEASTTAPEVDAVEAKSEPSESENLETVSDTTPEETLAEETLAEETQAEETLAEDTATDSESRPEATLAENTSNEESTPQEEAKTEAESTTAAESSAVEESTLAESDPETTSTSDPDATSATNSRSEPSAEQQDYRKPKVVSKRLFTLTLTYAVAATIMVVLLLYHKYLGDPHQLESLPDLKPPIKNDEIALQLIPEDATLPIGHVLKLGEKGRRFGNVMVTPLRVTRGPLEFEHYAGDKSRTRPQSQDVLKLYLRFENVSRDQTFEPLDQKLLLSRVPGKTSESQLRANNFVSRIDQKRTNGQRVLTYDMPPSWEWNLKGQNINQESKPQNLKPGDSIETYVATNEEGIDSLSGDLVWRLQLRKGFNPQSRRGVTTLIEVTFNSDQIQIETPSKNQSTQPTS